MISHADYARKREAKVVTDQRHILEKYPPFPPAHKALVSRLHGLPRWAVRPPLDTMSDAVLERALAELTQVGYA